jgi:hypothetical protein
MELEDRYRKLINDRHGKKLNTPVFQVSQSPFLYLTEKEIRTAINRAAKLFDDPEPVLNPTLIIARDGTIHRKVKGKKAVPVHTGKNIQQREIPSSVARVIMAENPEGYDTFDQMFEGGKPVKGILKSYYCDKCKRRHFSGTRTFDAHFEYARLTL